MSFKDSKSLDLKSAKEIEFVFNGKAYKGVEGQVIAAALFANGIRTIRHCDVTGEARGIYCGIGHCYECRATINGVLNKRTCLTLLREKMNISSVPILLEVEEPE